MNISRARQIDRASRFAIWGVVGSLAAGCGGEPLASDDEVEQSADAIGVVTATGTPRSALTHQDATMILDIATGYYDHDPDLSLLRAACDIKPDGKCTAADAVAVAKRIEGSGDVDGNGTLSWKDAVLSTEVAVGQHDGNENIWLLRKACDVSRDGQCSAADGLLLAKTVSRTGDADGDGFLTWKDADELLKIVVGLRDGVPNVSLIKVVCDLTADGRCTSADALQARILVRGNGDVDGSGAVTWKDARDMLKIATGQSNGAPNIVLIKEACDVSLNGACEASDALRALKLVANSGDVDADGALTWRDAREIAKISVGKRDADPDLDILKSVCDVNRDGSCSMADGLFVSQQEKSSGNVY